MDTTFYDGKCSDKSLERYTSDISGLNEKFALNDWAKTEEQIDISDQCVVNVLKQLGKNDQEKGISKLKVMGNRLFMDLLDIMDDVLMFKQFEKLRTLFPIKEDIPPIKSVKNAFKFKYENARDNICRNEILQIKKFFENGKMRKCDRLFLSNIVEVRGLWFFYAIIMLKYKKEEYLTYEKIEKAYQLMVAVQKFITSCMIPFEYMSVVDTTTKDVISTFFMNNLRLQFDEVRMMYKYDGLTLSDYAPQAIVYTDYDNAIPMRDYRPRQHQIELIEKTKQMMDDGFMIIYRTMIGSGKTFSVIALATLIEQQLRADSRYKNLQLIVCCNTKTVRDQVAKLCYHGGIKFGIMFYNNDEKKIDIRNHNICRSDADRIVIISGTETTYKLLCRSKLDDREKYMLFLDEPTVGADDTSESSELYSNMSVVSVAPKWTILSSATLPDVEKLDFITEKFVRKHMTSKIYQIHSNEFQIGCNLITFNDDQYVPFVGCINKRELEIAIQKVKNCSFLGRTYTMKVAKYLWKSMNEQHIVIPNRETLFSDVDQLTSMKVVSIIENLLNILSQQSDEVISIVCKEVKDDKEDIGLNAYQFTDDDIFERKEIEKVEILKEPVDFRRICTTQAYRYLGMTLIATDDPFKFVVDNFGAIISDINEYEIENRVFVSEGKYDSATKAMRIYEERIERRKKMIEDLRNTPIKKKDQTQNKISRDAIERKIAEIPEAEFPFPTFGQIKTADHIKKYCEKYVPIIPKRLYRNRINIGNICEKVTNVSDELLTLLFAGVGIYTNKKVSITKNYLEMVLDLANKGQLAYLIADSSICHGTNFPFNRVFITDEFAMKHSTKTLFQVMGRAGRAGKSWYAEAYVSPMVAERIKNYEEEKDIELENMRNTYIRFFY
jgi:hypothetical protein